MITLLSALVIALAQSPDPKEILRDAIQAGRDLKSIRYSVATDYYGQKVVATILEQKADVPPVGTIVPSKYKVEGKIGDEGYRYAYDGRAFRFIEKAGAAVQVMDNPSDQELGQVMFRFPLVAMPMFGGNFGRWLSSGKLTYKGTTKVGSWLCDLVEIQRKEQSPVGEMDLTVVFAFDRKTHLPVQIGDPTKPEKTVTKMDLNPKVSSSDFELSGKEVKVSAAEKMVEPLLPMGSVAPAFALKDPSGKVQTLKALRGKTVVVDFWGTWCLPCHKMMPKLQDLHRRYASKGLVVVGIAVADNAGNPAGFMKRNGYTYRLLLSGDSVAKAYKAKLLPTLYVIDRNGRIAYRQAGLATDRDAGLYSAVARLVGK